MRSDPSLKNITKKGRKMERKRRGSKTGGVSIMSKREMKKSRRKKKMKERRIDISFKLSEREKSLAIVVREIGVEKTER